MVKRVAYSVYAHKSNLQGLYDVLDNSQKDHLIDVLRLGSMLDYAIIKYNKQTDTVSLIKCGTWDTLNEPVVGDSYCYDKNLNLKIIKGGSKVYHNKWQFVADNYTGFDINKAKLRTQEWNKIPDIKSLKSKIGNKDFWYALLKQNHITI